jgi:hypothetical protein
VTDLAERSVPSDRAVLEALTTLHRAVAVHQFYPENHSMRSEAVEEGVRALARTEGDGRWETPGLQLRAGALWFGHTRLGEGSPAVGTLARTLSSHGVAVVRRRGSVSAEAYGELVRLLATGPEAHAPSGGAVQVWKRSSHAGVLELGGLAVSAEGRGVREGEEGTSPGQGEWGGGLAPGQEAELLAAPRLLQRLRAIQQRGPEDRKLVDLLLRLGRTEDMAAFLDLLREIGRVTEGYAEAERYREAYQVVVFLYREAQNMEAGGNEAKRDYLLDAIRTMVRGPFLEWLIAFVTSPEGGEEDVDLGEYVLRALGRAAVIPVINALVAERSRLGRRRLVDVLVSMGDVAVPPAAKMLEDRRWFVVRNMVTVLGGIASPAAHQALSRRATSQDARIRREVARSFGRGVGPMAEEHLILLLRDRDLAVRLMAISAAASHPSERVLAALQDAFHRTRVSSSEWSVKAGALRAIGRLGLPGGAGVLAAVVHKRPLLWRKRWRVLQRAAIQALGDLGGERAVGVLAGLRGHRDPALRAEVLRALAAAEKR